MSSFSQKINRITTQDAARIASQQKKMKEDADRKAAQRKVQASNMSDSEEDDMQNRQLQTNAFKKVAR